MIYRWKCVYKFVFKTEIYEPEISQLKQENSPYLIMKMEGWILFDGCGDGILSEIASST